eukprot:COSAG02_NODE_6902_length_3297_cov_92.257067_3_plen_323_part_00
MAGRYAEAQAAYDHAITQIQSLVAADTGRPWDAVQVELTKESLLVRETALELRRIQLQVPELLAVARKNASPASPDAALPRRQHIDHGAAERRRRPPTTFVQPVQPVKAQRAPQRDEGAAGSHTGDRRAAVDSDASATERRAIAEANAVDDPSVWSPPPKVERFGAHRRQNGSSVPSWARQVPAQQPRRDPPAQRAAGPRGPKSGGGRGDRWGEAADANPHAGVAPDIDRRRRRPSSGNGDKAWRNGMKPRDGRDTRGVAGGSVRTGGGGGRKDRVRAPDRRQPQYTPLAGDAELAEIIERDVLNRNPVRAIACPTRIGHVG